MNTPWGESQTVTQILPGIVNVTTASHGGIHLSDERMAKIPDHLKGKNVYGKGNWFEEDCEWAIVYLAFEDELRPTLGDRADEAMDSARRTMKMYYELLE